jgi:predicted metal-dependent peptidase
MTAPAAAPSPEVTPAPALDLDRLAAAKLWLVGPVGDQPYLATALYAVHPVATAEVATLTADTAWRLYVNPAWLAHTSVPQVAAQLAHVTWHLLLEHADRAATLDVGKDGSAAWRAATDVTVGETLQGCGLGGHGLPSPGSLGLAPARSAEEHYAVLARLPAVPPDAAAGGPPAGRDEGRDDGCGSAADGLRRGYEVPAAADLPAVDTLHAGQIRRSVAIEFSRHVSTRGTQPGDALRWVQHVLEPVVPWTQVLAAAVRRAAGWANGLTDYTYSRPSRRQAASPRVVLPATRRPLPRVAVVVDTSASMDDGLLAQALGEVDGAVRGLGVPGADVTVLACDAAVQAVATVRRGRDAPLIGGGGTDLRAGLTAALTARPRPDVVVVLTDGYTPWPATPPRSAATVVAVLHRRGDAPPPTPRWATRVECPLG